MKKFTSTDLGGAPVLKPDLKVIFNDEIWAAIEGIISQAGDCIVTGCVTTTNGGGFDMTAGIVCISGVLMRIPAATAQSFTKYIVADTPVNDSRVFADASTHVVAVTQSAKIQSGASGSLIISSITSLDSKRLRVYKGNTLSVSVGTSLADGDLIDTFVMITDYNHGATDLDNMTHFGTMYVDGSMTHAPGGVTSSADKFQLVISQYSANGTILQVATQTEGTNAGHIYWRRFNASWNAWTLINS